MRQRSYLPFLAITTFVLGLFILGKALHRWVSYTPPTETVLVEQGEKNNEEVKPIPGRDQSLISWRRNPFTLTTETLNEADSLPVISNLILKGTIIGSSKTAVLVTVEDPGQSYLVKVGDNLFGEEVVAIEKGRVVLRKDGKLLTLYQEKE